MDPKINGLLALAFRTASAMDANTEIATVRQELSERYGYAHSYEMILTDLTWENLALSVLPKMFYHLSCRGISFRSAPGVFLTIFRGDQVHFVSADSLIAYCRKVAGLEEEAFLAQVERMLKQMTEGQDEESPTTGDGSGGTCS